MANDMNTACIGEDLGRAEQIARRAWERTAARYRQMEDMERRIADLEHRLAALESREG